MTTAQLFTIAISVGIPLLTLSYTYGGLRAEVRALAKQLAERDQQCNSRHERHDRRFEQHDDRLRSGGL